MRNYVIAIVTIASAMIGTLAQTTCPPTNFDALSEFNLDEYIAERWYSLKQIVVPYQPLSQFYCVYADYAKVTTKSYRCQIFRCTDKPTISVFNSARRRSVNGNVNKIRFQATVTDPSNNPAKALVIPSFIPSLFRRGSNYWVVAAGTWADLVGISVQPSGETYDWAIITTNQPTNKGTSGCYSNGGMWLFSRTTTPPPGAIDAIENVAQKLGLDTDKWLPVEHNGCTYK